MYLFQQSGEAMLLAEEGQRLLAASLAARVRVWLGRLKAWQEAMPVTLPPTESR